MLIFAPCVRRVALCVLMFAAGKAFAAPSAGAAPQSAAPTAEIPADAPPSPAVCAARQESATAALSVLLRLQNYDEASEFVLATSPLLADCKGVRSASSAGSGEGPIAQGVRNYAGQLVSLMTSSGSPESALAELATTRPLQPVSALSCDAARAEANRLFNQHSALKQLAEEAYVNLQKKDAGLKEAKGEYLDRCGNPYPAPQCPKNLDQAGVDQMKALKAEIDILTVFVRDAMRRSAALKVGLTALATQLKQAELARDKVCQAN